MKVLMTIVALCALVGSTAAQVTTQERTERTAPARQSTTVEHQNLDHQIAACLLLGNQEEIALAQHAEQHALSPQVKAFAKMLADQHGKAVAMIQAVAPEVADLKLVASEPGDIVGRALTAPGTTTANPGLALLQRVKSECLQLTQKELSEHQGADFDKAYVGQQIGAHLGMLAQLRGSKSFASPELQKVIAEGERMTETHLAEAKKLMGQVKDQGSQTAARPTTTTPKQ